MNNEFTGEKKKMMVKTRRSFARRTPREGRNEGGEQWMGFNAGGREMGD
jgi:hypothetical protein